MRTFAFLLREVEASGGYEHKHGIQWLGFKRILLTAARQMRGSKYRSRGLHYKKDWWLRHRDSRRNGEKELKFENRASGTCCWVWCSPWGIKIRGDLKFFWCDQLKEFFWYETERQIERIEFHLPNQEDYMMNTLMVVSEEFSRLLNSAEPSCISVCDVE